MYLASLLLFLISVLAVFYASTPQTAEWPMFGGSPERRLVASMETGPIHWDPDTGEGIVWEAELGSQTYASPVVAGGKVFIGTNNDAGYNPSVTGDQGVLLAFRESDGKFLWQSASEKLASGEANDWPYVGVCSSPLVEADRLYYVNNRCELVCLDTEGFLDGENDGPFSQESGSQPTDADIIWKLDMIGQLGVFPHNASNSSPVSLGNLIFVGTSNGRSEDHSEVPAPKAPSLIAVDKQTGKVVWTDNSPGANILNGQWTSPTLARIAGIDQVIMGQGDGWVRSFEAANGKLLWEFDTNPPEATYPATRNEILATAGVMGNYVFIANGQDPENGEGAGHLYCIDARQRGNITNTGQIWHFSEIRRSISSPVLHGEFLYYPDFSGFLHCLDSKTGSRHWVHDTFAAIWGSPVLIGDKLYLGDEDGDVVILQSGGEEKVIAEINMGGPIYSTPTPANGRLYIATLDRLYAIE